MTFENPVVITAFIMFFAFSTHLDYLSLKMHNQFSLKTLGPLFALIAISICMIGLYQINMPELNAVVAFLGASYFGLIGRRASGRIKYAFHERPANKPFLTLFLKTPRNKKG